MSVAALMGSLVAPLTAGADDQPGNAIYSTFAESSAIQTVILTPLRIEPSIGYALSQTNQTPDANGKGSVVEPGLAGRVVEYVYFGQTKSPESSECFYPGVGEGTGPDVHQSLTEQPPSAKKEDDATTGAGIAICRSDDKPSNYSHASAGEGIVGGAVSFKTIEATSQTGYDAAKHMVSAVTEATLHGVKIGDVLTIDEITSNALSTAGAAGADGAASGVAISGAAVQGQRVAITEAGVVVKDPLPGSSSADAQKQVDASLDKAGVSVHLVKSTFDKGSEPGKTKAFSGGINVTVANAAAEKSISLILGQSTSYAKYRTEESSSGGDAGSSAGSEASKPAPYQALADLSPATEPPRRWVVRA
ncbi:MAG TPA: hypothetical protein VGO87_04320 [Acidimicrobiia bacterium]